jgi:lambda family phage portal protein
VSFADRLDSAIGALFPAWAADRKAARLEAAAMETLSNYRGAFHSRVDRSAPALRGAGPDWTLEREYDRREMVDRARQLEQNSILAEAMLSRATESVVGVGFALQSKTDDDGWNEAAEALWKEWTPQADVRGLCSFDELMALKYRSWLRDGDAGTVKLSSGKLRLVESDEIASPEGYGIHDGSMVDGVELDAMGKPRAFHVISNPRKLIVERRAEFDRIRVPAQYVEFLARRHRIGQTRGLSAFSGTAWILDQIDGNIEAVTVAARMAACLGLVLKRKTRMTGLATTTGADSIARKKLRLEPGSFMEVEPDEDITTVQGQQPHTNFSDFIHLLARIASVAFGLPVEITLMNFEKTNYSNARAALLQAWNVWRIHQRMLKGYASRVYTWKLISWMEAGLLPVREDALRHSWIAPGWQWLDPVAEVQSNLAAVDAGFRTRADIVMQLGGDFEEVMQAQRRELAAMEAAGVKVVHSTLTRDPIPEPVEAPGESPPTD